MIQNAFSIPALCSEKSETNAFDLQHFCFSAESKKPQNLSQFFIFGIRDEASKAGSVVVVGE